MTGHMN